MEPQNDSGLVLNQVSLTPRQASVLHSIRLYLEKNGCPPSIRDLVEMEGLHSVAPIQSALNLLREKGCVDWVDGKARTIRLIESSNKANEIHVNYYDRTPRRIILELKIGDQPGLIVHDKRNDLALELLLKKAIGSVVE